MAWNRSTDNQETKTPLRRTGAVHPNLRGVIAGVIVVVGTVIAVWVVLSPSGETRQDAVSAKRTLIKEVVPVVPTNTVPKVVETKPVKKTNAGAKTYIDEKGVKRYEGGARVFDRPRRAPSKLITQKPLFHNYAENQISALLMTEPGDTIFITRKYDKRFAQEFEKSLKEPIIVNETDTESDKEMKRTMNEVKAELAQRMRNGEDVCKIMEESYSELQRLSAIKRELVTVARDMLKDKPDMTAEEAADLIKATNKMLIEKGCAPIKNTTLLGRNFRLNLKGRQKTAK